ncbi:MAG: hypothetical protein WAM11_15415 [Cyanobium sp.]
MLFFPVQPARADAGRYLSGSDYTELSTELASLQDADGVAKPTLTVAQHQRLVDLQQLEQEIAQSEDRALLRNQTSHNLGFFARYKKDPADQPPQFFVLSPGHSNDDDFALVALLVPSDVALVWGEQGTAAANPRNPQVVRVLEGQQLSVSDATAAGGYRLSQPPFQLLDQWKPAQTVPSLSQVALDQEQETAPLD